MNQSFNQRRNETLEQREARLKAQADRIEQQLGANKPPQPQLRPKQGAMRVEGDKLGQKAANTQRMNLQEELEAIKKHRGEHIKFDMPKQGKSL